VLVGLITLARPGSVGAEVTRADTIVHLSRFGKLDPLARELGKPAGSRPLLYSIVSGDSIVDSVRGVFQELGFAVNDPGSSPDIRILASTRSRLGTGAQSIWTDYIELPAAERWICGPQLGRLESMGRPTHAVRIRLVGAYLIRQDASLVPVERRRERFLANGLAPDSIQTSVDLALGLHAQRRARLGRWLDLPEEVDTAPVIQCLVALIQGRLTSLRPSMTVALPRR